MISEFIMTLLVAGATGILIGGSFYVANLIKGYLSKRVLTNPLLQNPIFEKFLIPMIIPFVIVIMIIIFVLIMSFIQEIVSNT